MCACVRACVRARAAAYIHVRAYVRAYIHTYIHVRTYTKASPLSMKRAERSSAQRRVQRGMYAAARARAPAPYLPTALLLKRVMTCSGHLVFRSRNFFFKSLYVCMYVYHA